VIEGTRRASPAQDWTLLLNGRRTSPTLDGVPLALLEARLMAGEIKKLDFLEEATRTGLSASDANTRADKYLAIAANQAERRAALRRNLPIQ